MNAELIEMTMDELVETHGGEDLDRPWCFMAGAFTVLMIAGIAAGNPVAAIGGAALTGATGALCVNNY